jgi:hypothetical protein
VKIHLSRLIKIHTKRNQQSREFNSGVIGTNNETISGLGIADRFSSVLNEDLECEDNSNNEDSKEKLLKTISRNSGTPMCRQDNT